jgi:hypothetical protein
MATHNINGKWTGTIIYGQKYLEHSGKELYFDLDITQENESIKGIAIDTGGTGISPDAASISGSFSKNTVSFIKQYKNHHYYDKGKTVVDESRPGYEIYYTGIYDEAQKTFEGNWEYRVTYKILWIIPYKHVFGGTWNMHRR